MAHHEDKSCPRCGHAFECKVGNVLQCQCQGIVFTDIEKEYIRQTYPDCLCRTCLQVMRHELLTLNTQDKLKGILNSKKS